MVTTLQSGQYIGPTKWSELQKQYAPNILESLIERRGADIYWKGTIPAPVVSAPAPVIAPAEVLPFAGQVSKIGQEVFTAPTTIPAIPSTKDLEVTGVTPTLPEPKAPAIIETYTTSALTDLANKKTALDAAYQQQLSELKTKETAVQTKMDELTAQMKGMLETDIKPLTEPFRAELETTERARLKVEENYFANQKLVEELDTLLTQIQADLKREKEVTGLAAIREPRIAKATEDATARVGVIEATMAARNNQISVANNLIDRTVNAITADRQDQLNYYTTLFNFYDKQRDEEGNKLITLTAEEKGWLSKQIGLLESDLASSQANVDYIKTLMVDPDTAQIVAQSGVTLNDSPQQVQKKFADYAYQQEKIDLDNKMVAQGYQYIAIPQLLVGKSEVDLMRLRDSKGNERIYWKPPEIIVPKATGGVGVGGVGTTGVSPDVETYAQDVLAGRITLSSVPDKIQAQVSRRVSELEVKAPVITDWDKAKQFVIDNPDASDEELVNTIRQYTKLSISDAQRVVKETKPEKETTKEDIIKWAKEVYDKGYKDSEVKAMLVKEGYPSDWIKEAIDRLKKTWWEKLWNLPY